MSLRRKIFIVPFKKTEVPEKIRDTLCLLSDEEYLGVKGGYAKAVLGQMLINAGKIHNNLALNNNLDSLDLDIVLTFVGTRKNNIDNLSKRVTELTEKLKTVIQLHPEDVEMLSGNLHSNEKTVRKFLESRDLTINEVVLIPKDGNWLLVYTDKCYRDTINSTAMLAANGKGTVRYDYGRLVAGPYGICRLVRFLVEGKVKSIYLPKWWIERNNQEARRLNKENLGVYGLILAERYLKKPSLQSELIKALNALELTDLIDFGIYKREQEVFFKLQRNNKEFNFNHSRTFREIQQHLIEKEEQRKISQSQRKKFREECNHKNTEKFVCRYCPPHGCTIEACGSCTKRVIASSRGSPIPISRLFCNVAYKQGNVYHDKASFFPYFPDRNRNRHKRY